jgi:two-component system NtrC family sensor kinase
MLDTQERLATFAAEIDDLAGQLDRVLDGDLDLGIRAHSGDARVQRLAAQIDALVDTARRATADRSQEHRDLEESEQRHRDYITNTPYGVFVTDEQGRYMQVNPAACRLTGYSEQELLGLSIPELLFPEDLAQGMAHFQALVSEGRAYCELPFRAKSGERRWWSVSGVQLSATRFIGFCHDITERKEAEAELRESRAVLHEVLNAIPVRVFWKDKDLRYLGCNMAFAQDAGFESPEALLGKDDYAMAWRDEADMYRADDQAVIDSGEARLLFEEPQTTARGDRLHLLTSKLPLRDAASAVIGVLGTYHDITPLRRAQEEKGRLEDQLRQSQKLQAVGQLAAGIAHEINTPAQFVGDSIQFLEDSYAPTRQLIAAYREALAALPATPELADWRARMAAMEAEADIDFVLENVPAALHDAQDGVSRISSIVRAMKEFAHPDEAEKAAADLNRALEATLTIARNEYKYVADVETDFGELPPVLCHMGDLNQVFLNLLVNAAHAIGDVVGKTGAKGQIRVRTAREGNAARIEIADSGGGIPAAIRERVFEPFFTTKPVGKGSGQGLAIAHAIVVGKHGGVLSFESREGQGTTFIILLPLDGRPLAVAPPIAQEGH